MRQVVCKERQQRAQEVAEEECHADEARDGEACSKSS